MVAGRYFLSVSPVTDVKGSRCTVQELAAKSPTMTAKRIMHIILPGVNSILIYLRFHGRGDPGLQGAAREYGHQRKAHDGGRSIGEIRVFAASPRLLRTLRRRPG